MSEKTALNADKPAQEVTGNKIAWLDQDGLPSKVHRSEDNGATTVCGQSPATTWQTAKITGGARHCSACFADGGKKLPWLEELPEAPWRPAPRPGELFPEPAAPANL